MMDWPAGRAVREAVAGRIPHVRLDDGSIKFNAWQLSRWRGLQDIEASIRNQWPIDAELAEAASRITGATK